MSENLNYDLFNKYEVEIKKVLKPERYWHSISVALTAVNLSNIYNVDKDEALVSGLLHDYAKNYTYEEQLILCEKYGLNLTEEDKKATGCIHGFLSAKIAKEKFNVNHNIYNAIYYHTCGKPNMTNLEKLIYISDFIEPLRKFRDKIDDVRNLVLNNEIDKAIPLACEMTMKYLKNNNQYMHINTIKTYEYYKDKKE